MAAVFAGLAAGAVSLFGSTWKATRTVDDGIERVDRMMKERLDQVFGKLGVVADFFLKLCVVYVVLFLIGAVQATFNDITIFNYLFNYFALVPISAAVVFGYKQSAWLQKNVVQFFLGLLLVVFVLSIIKLIITVLIAVRDVVLSMGYFIAAVALLLGVGYGVYVHSRRPGQETAEVTKKTKKSRNPFRKKKDTD